MPDKKIKNKEELTKEEALEFYEISKNTKMEKVLQGNEWIIDLLIKEKFEDALFYELFVARCRDVGEPITSKPGLISRQGKVLQRGDQCSQQGLSPLPTRLLNEARPECHNGFVQAREAETGKPPE